MQLYELTAPAQADLEEVARYTLTTWSEKQSLHYAELLESHFREIAVGVAYSRPFSERYPQVLVSRCEHHYIFHLHLHLHLHRNGKPPCIIAVLHERMDMLKRLKNRLA